MMAGSHLALGLAAWAWAAPHMGFSPVNPLGLGLAGLGSLLPDIDHPQSWVGQRARVVSRPLARLAGHRGVTHSLLAVVLGVALLRTHRWLCAPLAVGWLSHLAADLVTPRGLRLAWPLRRHWALPLCRTGSAREVVIVTLLVTGAAWWMVAGPWVGWVPGHRWVPHVGGAFRAGRPGIANPWAGMPDAPALPLPNGFQRLAFGGV